MPILQLSEWLPTLLIPFFSLSYPTDTPADPDSFTDSAHYNTGRRDICLVITCIAVMAALRDTLRLGVFEPFAQWKLSRDLELSRVKRLSGQVNGTTNGNASSVVHTNGHIIQSHHKEARQMHRRVLRFAEQGWSAVYYILQWSFGLYVHRNLPTKFFDPTDLWLNYPHIPIAGPVKLYYLTQIAFYLHQVLILNAEARRKDHVQMMTHHIITIALLVTSYFFNFTRVGCLIVFLMDWCDIFLPLAKMMRYLNINQLLCDMTFALFLVSWFITRHALFLFTIVSTYYDCPRLIPFEWTPERGRYLSRAAWIFFCVFLFSLQVLQAIWFWMICRVAWRVITTGKGASDDRSDDDESEEQRKDQ